MTTEEVGKKLVELCRNGEFLKAVESLYAKNIVSVEPRSMKNMPAEMHGLDQVRAKGEWFMENHEMHDSKVTGPFVAGATFVVQFDIDVTAKASNERMRMSEVGIYTVKEGKITHERFLPLSG